VFHISSDDVFNVPPDEVFKSSLRTA